MIQFLPAWGGFGDDGNAGSTSAAVRADRRRRALILGGVAAYSVMRVWTYLVFAETRLDIALHTLSPSDVEWFKQTLATDFRIVLNVVTYLCLTLAALLPLGMGATRGR